MGGGGRPRSANAERGTVVVDGTTFEYTLYTGKKRSRWQIKFCEPGQKQITADFKNGDEDDEPTMVLRIREKLARMRAAAAEAPAPAPAQKPSPFRNKKRDRTEVELPNVSPSAAWEFRRPTWAEQQASAQRNKQTQAIIDARLAEADHLDTKVQRLRDLKAKMAARARAAEATAKRDSAAVTKARGAMNDTKEKLTEAQTEIDELHEKIATLTAEVKAQIDAAEKLGMIPEFKMVGKGEGAGAGAASGPGGSGPWSTSSSELGSTTAKSRVFSVAP